MPRRLPFMLERIRRCQTCGVEMDRPPLEYQETPFCANCLSKAVREVGSVNVTWKRNGHYLETTKAVQRRE